MLKKLFSHTAIYGIAPHITKVISVFTLPIITKHLTELDFGIYGYITSLIGAISIFSNLGLNVILSNTYYKYPKRYTIIWRQIYGLLTIWSIPYTLILSFIIYYFIPAQARDNTLWIILLNVSPIILFGPTSIIGNLYFQLSQKPLQIAYRTIVVSTLTIIFNVLFIAVFKLGYIGWFLSVGIAQIVLQASYWYPLNKKLGIRPIFYIKWRFIRKNLLISLPTIPHYYGAFLLNSSDKLIMNKLNVPMQSIGLYNGASTISNFFMYFGNAAGQAGSPLMLKAYKKGEENVARKIVFTLQIAFFCLGFIVCLWLKEIFVLLIKNIEIQKTYDIGIILVMAYCYRPMYLGAVNKIFYTEDTKVLFKVTLIAGLISVLFNVIFIPIYSFKIAALSLMIGLLYMGYSGYFLKKFKKNTSLNYYPLYWLSLHIILTIAVYYLVNMDVQTKVFITFFTIILILIGYYLFKKKIK